MTLLRLLGVAAIAGLLVVGMTRRPDPHRTLLPIGTADLASVRSQLEALPDSERALVVAYVRRSGGDVLPPKFADPDEPLTARTFVDAIRLQRQFLRTQAVVDAEAAARGDARE